MFLGVTCMHEQGYDGLASGGSSNGAQGAWAPLFSATKILIFIIVFTHSFVNIINAGNDAVDHCLFVHSISIVVG